MVPEGQASAGIAIYRSFQLVGSDKTKVETKVGVAEVVAPAARAAASGRAYVNLTCQAQGTATPGSGGGLSKSVLKLSLRRAKR
jgi:hypothetical protein